MQEQGIGCGVRSSAAGSSSVHMVTQPSPSAEGAKAGSRHRRSRTLQWKNEKEGLGEMVLWQELKFWVIFETVASVKSTELH